MGVGEVGALLAWGTAVGLDLASGPQLLLARPLVAGTVAGLVLGAPASGLALGAALELYALAVLPVGAARYPDYGPATVGATLLAAHGGTAVGWALLLALGMAVVGGRTLQWLRAANGRAIAAARAALDAGDVAALARIQRGGLARDALRALALTATALVLAGLAARLPPAVARAGRFLEPALVATGLAVAAAGAVRVAGDRRRRAGLVLGAVLGLAAGALLR